MHDAVWRKAIRRETSAVFCDGVSWKDGLVPRIIFRRHVRPDRPKETEDSFFAEMVVAVSKIKIDGECFTAVDTGTVNWKGKPAYFAVFAVIR